MSEFRLCCCVLKWWQFVSHAALLSRFLLRRFHLFVTVTYGNIVNSQVNSTTSVSNSRPVRRYSDSFVIRKSLVVLWDKTMSLGDN